MVAPAITLASGVAAFAVANEYDFPPGQVAIVFLCALLAVARIGRRSILALSAWRGPR